MLASAQTRPTVALPSVAGRNVASRSRGHFVGHLLVGPGRGRVLQVESNLERNAALLFTTNRNVVRIEEQVPFEWYDEQGEVKTHFFDFALDMVDEQRIAVAVKPSTFAEAPKFLGKMLRIAKQAVPSQFNSVRIFTERDIDPIDLFNAKAIHASRDEDFEADEVAKQAVLLITASATIRDLVDLIGMKGRGYRALVRMIGRLELCLVRHERIGVDALVCLGEVA